MIWYKYVFYYLTMKIQVTILSVLIQRLEFPQSPDGVT